jgi:hypothetical protein
LKHKSLEYGSVNPSTTLRTASAVKIIEFVVAVIIS